MKGKSPVGRIILICVPGTSEQIEYENASIETKARNSLHGIPPWNWRSQKRTVISLLKELEQQLAVNKKITTHGKDSY